MSGVRFRVAEFCTTINLAQMNFDFSRPRSHQRRYFVKQTFSCPFSRIEIYCLELCEKNFIPSHEVVKATD